MTSSDYVEFTIHPLRRDANSLSLLRSECLAIVSKYSVNYLWHQDIFNIKEIGPGNGSGDHRRNFLHGKVHVGDNVEDEWYVVSLLLELSKIHPDLVIRITDQDGELLLIETADRLPRWAQDPEQADGRAFIHRGDLHLIPIAQSPGQLTPMPMAVTPGDQTLNMAADIVRRFSDVTRAADDVQEGLRARLGNYPGDWSAFQHYTHMFLLPKAKYLLDKHPQLAAKAITAFYQRDPIDLRMLRVPKHFDPKTSKSVKSRKLCRDSVRG